MPSPPKPGFYKANFGHFRNFLFFTMIKCLLIYRDILKKNISNSNVPKVVVFFEKNEGKVENRCGRKRKKPRFWAVFLKFPQVWSAALDPCGAGGRFRKDQRLVQFPKTVFLDSFDFSVTHHETSVFTVFPEGTRNIISWAVRGRMTQYPSSLWKNTPKNLPQVQ